MATTVTKSRNGDAIAARTDAVRQLIANHPDEFSKIFGDEREKRGLPREAGGESARAAEEKLARALLRQEEAQAALTHAGTKVDMAKVEEIKAKIAKERAEKKAAKK